MNRTLALFLFCAAIAVSACAKHVVPVEATGGLVVVNPVGNRPTFFDFGKVSFGSPTLHVFQLRNDDAAPVVVHDLIASCGCTTPRISYRTPAGEIVAGNPVSRDKVITIPPGVVADVAVAVDTTRVEVMNRDKLAQVRMRSDSKTTPYLTFEVHLLVERVMRAVPAEIELGQVPQSVGKTGRSDLTVDVPGTRAQVLGIESVEGPFTASVDATQVNGVTVWVLVANAKPDQPVGPVSGRVVLSVSGEDGTGKGPPFQVMVRAQIAPDVVVRPPVLLLGSTERGKVGKVQGELVALIPGERLHVLSTTIATEPESVAAQLAVVATPIEPADDGSAEKWTIVLSTSDALAEPAFSGTLTIRLDHPRVPEIRVPFSGARR
jgi:hypothetical protein